MDSELKEGVDAPGSGSSLWSEGPEISAASAAVVLDVSVAPPLPAPISAPASRGARRKGRIIAV